MQDKEALKKYKASYYLKNKARLNEEARNYYKKNKKRMQSAHRLWAKKNRERMRELTKRWKEENPERFRELAAKAKMNWYWRNIKEAKQRQKIYREKNREKELQRLRLYRQRNIELLSAKEKLRAKIRQEERLRQAHIDGKKYYIYGISERRALRIIKRCVPKTKLISTHSKTVILWIDAERYLNPKAPDDIKIGIRAMAKFQRWYFNSRHPRKKILELIKKNSANQIQP